MIGRGILLLLLAATAAPDAPRAPAAPASRPANLDLPLWQRMLAIDQRGAGITDLSADFEQRKFTAMLKKPLVSGGEVFVRGSAMLWDTRKPERNVLQITEREVRIYHPAQKTIEVYAVEQKLGQLAASPLPRLSVLLKHFTFEPLALSEMGEKDEANFLALRMTPTQAELREHVEEVCVLLDSRQGLIVRLEMRDPDGDRTLLTFSNVRTNVGLKDEQLTIAASADVKITRPLAALESEPQPPSRNNKQSQDNKK